jgi:surface antigen
MTWGRIAIAALAAALMAAPVYASSPKTKAAKPKVQTAQTRAPDYLNCVQYVKQTTDFGLAGDAWRWWDAAAGRFERGKTPREGAILVFKKTDKLRFGHVAVVSNVVDKRRIEIDHANWAPRGAGKGKVSTKVSVEDISPKNDWTLVRVWYDPANEFGKPYPTYGFVLPKSSPGRTPTPFTETILTAALTEAPEIGELFDVMSDGSIAARSRVAARSNPATIVPRP